jgi:hypothetical protein
MMETEPVGIAVAYVYPLGSYTLGNDNSTGVSVDLTGNVYFTDSGANSPSGGTLAFFGLRRVYTFSERTTEEGIRGFIPKGEAHGFE